MSKLTQEYRSKGGHARAAKMTPEQRSDCARKAALHRWSKLPKTPRKPDMREWIKWVSVEERMPPDFRLVLLSNVDGSFEGFATSGSFLGIGGRTPTSKVTHWAELPKGPKPQIS